MLPNRRPRRGPRLLAGLLLGVLVGLAVTAFLLVPAALTHKDASAVELAYAQAVVGVAVQLNSQPIPVATPESPQPGRTPVPTPTPPTDLRVKPNAGRNAFTGLCAQCHGSLGDGKGPLGQQTFPPAADLTGTDVKRRTDSELKSIIQTGLGFTGMPGFGDQLDADNLAAVVAYVRDLQDGKARPIDVPTATPDLLALADPKGQDAQRGGALFYSRGCVNCHGPIGSSPDELGLQDISQLRQSIRHGQPGMPIFSSARLTDAQIDQIEAYLQSVPSSEEG